MQGTLVMLVALSGLGCHNRGCDVAYGPSTYTGCFGGGYSGCYANVYPGPAMPACYAGCYGGGYSGCYGGYSSGYAGCYGGCYGGGCYGGWYGGCYGGGGKHKNRCGGCLSRLFSCFHKRRAACYDCGYAPIGPGVLRLGLRPGGLRVGPGHELWPGHLRPELRFGPIDDGPLEAMGRDDGADDPVRGDDSRAADPGDAAGGDASGHRPSTPPPPPVPASPTAPRPPAT